MGQDDAQPQGLGMRSHMGQDDTVTLVRLMDSHMGQADTKISTCARKDSMKNRPKQTTTNKNINFIIRLYERYRMRLVFSIVFV